MLKCWRDIPGYQLFVRDKWKPLQVDGWGCYVLKEKLKLIKAMGGARAQLAWACARA
jgi:hypothetical protein